MLLGDSTGGGTAADQVPLCWLSYFSWAVLCIHTQCSAKVLELIFFKAKAHEEDTYLFLKSKSAQLAHIQAFARSYSF